MFGTIRKHQNWLWLIIIVVIILSFVVYFSPYSKLNNAPSAHTYSYNGKPVTIDGRAISLPEFQPAYKETLLSHFFRSGGTWPGGDESAQQNLQRDAIFRLFLMHKMKELDIQVSETAVAKMAHDRIGNYPLAKFDQDHLQPHSLTIEDFERFLRHETQIQQLVNVATVSARLVNPREAEVLFRKEHQEVDAQVAVFWASNFLDQVAVTPAGISNYYNTRMSLYRQPERVQVNYVAFDATNFLAEADKKIAETTNFNVRVDEVYFKLGTNYFKDTNGVPLTETAAKQKIKDEERHRLALTTARQKASEFGTELYNQQISRLDAFEKMAADKQLPVKTTPPFDRVHGLEDLEFPPEFAQKAMLLNEQQAVNFTPLVGDNGVYVIALKKKIPSELPPLDKIQDKVIADYKNSQAQDLARKAGLAFNNTLTNALAQNKTFSDACVEAKVKTVSLPPFSPSSSANTFTNLDERLDLRRLQQIAFELKPGKASEFQSTKDGGFILYLRGQRPFDEEKVQRELPEFVGRLRQYRQNEAFNQWFRKQAQPPHLILAEKETSVSSPGGGQPGS